MTILRLSTALFASLGVALALCGQVAAQNPSENQLGPDSRPQPGVPKGEVLKFSFDRSKIFPGTYRDYWIYVPAQYRPDKPACLYVNQDGVQWNAPVVFDNLIHKGEMPVTIGLFVMHGRVRPGNPDAALDRFNRSLEYDGLGDRYARFIIEEMIPEMESKKTSDGRAIRVSKDGNDHAIGGSSSGAVAAFTAAWERPDQFSRVFSTIGTYVGLRGADRYPTLLRKYEPKPLRVFLQDGSNDLNIYAGDWWMANQMMERALTFAGYEVTHVWGQGGHNGQHGTALFPDAMRWLWKGWPARVRAGKSKNRMLAEILVDGQTWQAASGDLPQSGPKNANGKTGFPAGGVRGVDGVALNNGNVYVAELPKKASDTSKIWLVRPNGKKQLVDTGIKAATGVTASPDQTLLYVADGSSHWVYSYQIQPDGTLAHKQQYYWLHSPDDSDDAGAGGMCTDREGRLYVATKLGVQVADQPGRVNCILPTPNGALTTVRFGGPNRSVLYAWGGGQVVQRQLKATGADPAGAPNKPPVPGL